MSKLTTSFAKDMADMVGDHVPRVFAVVLEFGEQIEAEIIAWGLAFDNGAYMATVDGRNQYALASAEGALKYVRTRTNTTPHLIWADSGHPDASADPR